MFQVWGLKDVVLRFFSDPLEEFFPGVIKSGQQNRPTRYRFLPVLVGPMTSEKYLQQLGESGFSGKYHLVVFLAHGSKIIKFEGAGGQCPSDLPQIIFSEGEAHFEVPHSLRESRDWDDIAMDMASLFGKPEGSS